MYGQHQIRNHRPVAAAVNCPRKPTIPVAPIESKSGCFSGRFVLSAKCRRDWVRTVAMMAAANGTTRAGSVGSASPAGAMLRLLRLTLLTPVSCRELPKSRRSGGAMLISPVLFIGLPDAAMPREGKRRRFPIFYPDLLRQPVTGRCSESVWPRPPHESICVAAFLSVVALLGDDVCAEPFETYRL